MNEKSSSEPGNKFTMIKKSVKDFLHEKNSFTHIFELAEKYSKVSREYLFLGIVGLLVIYLVVGYGAGLVVNLLGFVYPAYKSCKAIDSERTDDDTQWLTYWVVYAAFGIIEYFTDIILSWIPFYFLMKCGFLVWCMLPMANNGAEIIYHRFIKLFMKKHEKDFDAAISSVTQVAKETTSKVISAAKDAAGNIDLQKLQQLQKAGESLSSTVNGASKKDD